MSKRLTTAEFVQKAQEIHGEKYDYSETEYVGNNTKVTIICRKHGRFEQLPANHLRGFGCKECSAEGKSKNQTSSKDEFVGKAIKIHGDKYDYSLVEYNGANNKVKIRCRTCGRVFEQTPGSHIYGRGCPQCAGRENMGLDDFIKRAVEKHGESYDYSKAIYVNSKTPLLIVCKKCKKEFLQTPEKHLLGHGCPDCGIKQRAQSKTKPEEDFIKEATAVHKGKYDYANVHYTNTHTAVEIVCPQHGVFPQTPKAHLKGQGCPQCAIERNAERRRLDISTFINKANAVHNSRYQYTNIKYKNSSTPIEIICPIHGPFLQDPHNHLQGAGCPRCANNLSKAEEEIFAFLKNAGLDPQQHNRKILEGLELDIYLPAKKVAIEYNGLYWHNEVSGKDKRYHLHKTETCEKQGIRLIHIFEDEWVQHKEMILSRLGAILGVDGANRIYARNCEIRDVEPKVAREFLSANHLQGATASAHRLGLYHQGELVSLMTFGGTRRQKKHVSDYDETFELLRFCNKINTTVTGGASRLLKRFIDDVKPKTIITYADRRWSGGNLYKQLGFTHTHNSEPNYFYIVDGKRENRFKFHKANLVKQGFDESKSEHEIMLERGIYRIYDCGNMVFRMDLRS